MYLQLDEYPPYSDFLSYIFDTNINSNLGCYNGYTNYTGKKPLITWVSKQIWYMFHSYFPEAKLIIPSTGNNKFCFWKI